MPNLTSLMAWSFRWTVAGQSALRRRPLHVPQGCDHPDIQKQGSESIIGRRVPEKGCTCVGRLVWSTITVDGVELSLAPTPNQSSQKNRPDAPYEGLPPNRWMPGTNAKCPSTPDRWGSHKGGGTTATPVPFPISYSTSSMAWSIGIRSSVETLSVRASCRSSPRSASRSTSQVCSPTVRN
jgi:hypothetical protein